jgi:Protein of unknown function (DUF2726)
MTEGMVFLIFVAFVVAACLEFIRGGSGSVRFCRGRFLSQNEKEFLGKLDRIIGARYRVFVQVRLADLVGVEAAGNRKARWKSLSQVFGKSVDFVICNRTTLDPVMVIEVDDRSHEAADRRRRDALVDRVCAEAGLSLVRVKARFSYGEGELVKKLQAAGLGLAPNLNVKGN